MDLSWSYVNHSGCCVDCGVCYTDDGVCVVLIVAGVMWIIVGVMWIVVGVMWIIVGVIWIVLKDETRHYNSKRDVGSKVFINEDLTKSRSKLAYEARRLKKENKINDCWTASGRILVKDRQDKIVQICSDNDIKQFD